MRSTVRPSWHVILTAALLVALVAAPLAAAPLVAPAQAADQSLVFEALQVLQTHYVDPVNAPKVLNAAVAAGVHEFDRIMKVNDLSTGGLTVDQVAGMIRGPAGTPVTVTFQRPGMADPLVVTMTRAPILVPSIFRTDLLDGGVGYVRLYPFVEGTGRDVRNALTRLLAGGMRVLVLDLRGNSGGYLHELDNVLNALLPFGVPVYTEMLQGGQVEVVRTTRPPLLQASIPVVLMVDEGSASAAELLAAAIQENHRGVLVGAKTSGAVEASVMIDLSDGSALSVTTFRLATGHGVRLEGAGVEPDVTTAMTVEDLDAGQDRKRTKAVRLARP